MTHCLCKPLIQGLVELRLFSLFFPCLFSSPVNRLKTESNPIQKVISTKLTAGKLPYFPETKALFKPSWLKLREPGLSVGISAGSPSSKQKMKSSPAQDSQDGWSRASLRQDRPISILLLAFTRFPTHSIELQPVLQGSISIGPQPVLWLMPHPSSNSILDLPVLRLSGPLRMREANDRSG